MLFGNKNDFAIEAMIEAHLKAPSHPWGRLCIWVEGTQIGDYEDPHCGLFPSYDSFNETCDLLNDLWELKFANYTDMEIWNYLDAILYGYHGNIELDDERTLDQTWEDSEIYSKYNFLTNWGEMFDRDGKSFIMKTPNGTIKVLNFDYDKNEVNSYICSELSFRQASRGFATWYEEQLKLLDSKNA